MTRTAIDHVLPTLNAYRDTLKKFKNFVHQAFEKGLQNDLNDSLEVSLATYIAFGIVPSFMSSIFSRTLGERGAVLNRSWIRDTLIGWRRKFDSSLRSPLQLERLPSVYHQIASEIAKLGKEEEYIKLISTLEKAKVLHLLALAPELDLTPILEQKNPPLVSLYQDLKAKNFFVSPKFSTIVNSFLKTHGNIFTPLSASNIANGIDTMLTNIKSNLAKLKVGSTSYKNTQTFENKVLELQNILLKINKTQLGEILEQALQYYLPGADYTKALVTILNNVSKKYSQLGTALRGIVASAYASKYNFFSASGVANSLVGFEPTKIASFPFLSPRRNKEEISFENPIMGALSVRVRKKLSALSDIASIDPKVKALSEHLDEKTLVNALQFEKQGVFNSFSSISRIFKDENREVWLTIPMYDLSFFRNNIIQSSNPKDSTEYRERFMLPLRINFSKKILDSMNNGAEIANLKILVPEAPSNKLVVAVTLRAENRNPFEHRTNFIKYWDDNVKNLSFPKTRYLGSDFNEIGEYIITLGTPDLPISLTPLTKFLGLDKTKKKLDKYISIVSKVQSEISQGFQRISFSNDVKKEVVKLLLSEGSEVNPNNVNLKIASTSRLLAKGTPSSAVNAIKTLMLKRELLERKRRHIWHDALNKVAMIIAYTAKKMEAGYIGWDDISEMTSRELTGRLASAVSYVPRQNGLKGLLMEWLEDLHLPREVRDVNPHTSSICAKCGNRFPEIKDAQGKRIYQLYHKCENQKCANFNKPVNRHENAAQVSAQTLKKEIEAQGSYASQWVSNNYYNYPS